MFKCAFYEREITPPLGCNLPGYANLRAGSDVKDRLMAKACVVSDGDETVALIALDSLHIFKETRDKVAKRVSEFTGIPEENVLLAAIHSHTGIPAETYSGDEKAEENQSCYFDVFPKIIADCAILAYKRLEDSEMYFSMGEVEGISFCRDYLMKNSTPRTNPGRLNPDIIGPASETDNELPVLFVRKADGTPSGAIVSFACHLDCVGGTEYSGDFASELSKQMKKVYGEDFVTVFFIGTAGDINHFNVNTAEDAPDHYRMMGRKVAGEVMKTISFAEPLCGEKVKVKYEFMKIKRVFVSEQQLEYARHIVKTVKEVPGVKIAADGTSKELYELMMAKKLLWAYEGSPEVYDVPLHYIEIGELKFFGFPSEIFCFFGKDLKKRCKGDKHIVASCCNAAFGYVPTKELLYDTIYESRVGSNRLEKDAGYMMVEKFLEMSEN